MSKSAANPTVAEFNKAARALSNLEQRQRRAFDNFAASWKGKRASILADINDDAFAMLRAGNVCTSNDERVRSDALKAKETQEVGGGEEVAAEDLIDVDSE